ncbi:MAG: hypothetical protein H0X72_12565 [Acidobacteria bacterium]|jgi:myo-inositol-1(or 4)-monophosphatase|nr:hypothetical protein [Acidobacteriota bacterium]MBA4123279.1 hypothetical protein [Acidobacteriota bacterium]MBA4186007.1 hypothetical protein [Acidobacteriota bacterium]
MIRNRKSKMNMAYVAGGRFDGFWYEGLNPWDIAPGVLLIDKVGGRVPSLRTIQNSA